MFRRKFAFMFILLTIVRYSFSQTQTGNPLLIHSNNPIAFNLVNAKIIREAVTQLIDLSNQRVQKIVSGLKPGAGPGSTLAAYDQMSYDLNDLGVKLGLISNTHPDDSSRNAANDGSQALSDYQTSLILNVAFYKAFKKYADESLPKLKPNQQKYVKEQLRIFENNGMKLDSLGRQDLQAISDKMTALGIAFDRNIAISRDSIIYLDKDLEGIPASDRKAWKRPGGLNVLYVNTPNYVEVSEHAASDATRKLMFYRYNNRAYPQNMTVLDSLLYYRQKYAKKLGYKSYAAYALTDKMAASPQNVWNFENNLIQKLTPRVKTDIASIKAIKHEMHPELPDSIFAWDVRYYKNVLLDTKYQLNTDALKEYFEMDETIKGLFNVYHRILGITVKEISGRPAWYSKVRSFDMYVGPKKVGSFYFDLYPRQDKYTHFACFPISEANVSGGKDILPVAALICNFPEGSNGEPSLLSHEDVITFFHEFGHLVHFLVVRSDLASQPYTIKPDFVEAPSQFLENFCWQYDVLRIFARNYKTGAVLPDTLFQKLKATEHVLDGNAYMQQLYYGSIDFTFEDKYDSIRGKDLVSVTKNLFRMTQIPFPDGTHMIASFGHLNGYGANYYGYLWSLVFAQDIFSVFETNGIMDSKTGERYRKEILEVAASEEEMDMLRHFLGREPNSDAFMKSLGL